MKPKFRALDKISKKMFPVTMIDFGQSYVMIEEINGLMCERDFNEIELMQSTRLRDRNGMEIYDGDIVKYKSKKGTFTDIASFNKFFACFGLEDDTGDWFCSFDWLLENVGKDGFEVIGNVYENPELLEGEE